MKQMVDIDFLMKCSQQLWAATGFKALLVKFADVLSNDFGVEFVTYLTLEPPSANEAMQARPLTNFRVLEPQQSKALRHALSALEKDPQSVPETFDGLLHVNVENINYALARVSEPSTKPGLLAWKYSDLARQAAVKRLGVAAPESLVTALDFLVRQIQGQCRWFHKVDSAQAMLYQDDLTGLYNYRYLDVALDAELRRASRFGQGFSLMFIDLDQFKPINDKFGHLSGSSVLKQVAQRLRDAVREVDAIIRYGGDEFVIVLIGASSAAARLAAERVRQRIASLPFRTDSGELVQVTASIGVATCPEHTSDRKQLLQLADDAMYRSKKNGKNRISIAHMDQDASNIGRDSLK